MSTPEIRRRVMCALLAAELVEARERAAHACAVHTAAPSIPAALESHMLAVRALRAEREAHELYVVACTAPLGEA